MLGVREVHNSNSSLPCMGSMADRGYEEEVGADGSAKDK